MSKDSEPKDKRVTVMTLIDIGYTLPTTIIVGYFIGDYLVQNQAMEGAAIAGTLIGAGIGFVLTIFKINKYVQQINCKQRSSPPSPPSTFADSQQTLTDHL